MVYGLAIQSEITKQEPSQMANLSPFWVPEDQGVILSTPPLLGGSGSRFQKFLGLLRVETFLVEPTFCVEYMQQRVKTKTYR